LKIPGRDKFLVLFAHIDLPIVTASSYKSERKLKKCPQWVLAIIGTVKKFEGSGRFTQSPAIVRSRYGID